MKLRIMAIIIAALVFFQSSSPWEGAGAVAPEGVLPASGRFIATNSFPRNTVVDITNIENNRSIRVIVADSLDSPGLLALVSREAAELIGMKAGSVSRIRMIQPSDPIAYLRFMEGAAAGFPGIDPDSLITEENLLEELYKEDTYRPPVVQPSVVTTPVPPIVNPSYVVEREWLGPARTEIVDVPGYNVNPYLYEDPNYAALITEETKQAVQEPKVEIAEPVREERIVEPVREPVYVAEITQPTAPVVQPEIVKDVSSRYEERPASEVIKDITPFHPERTMDEIAKDVPVYVAETNRNEVIKDASVFVTGYPNADIYKETPVYVTEVPREEILKEVSEWERAAEIVRQPEPAVETPVTPPAPVIEYNVVETQEQTPPSTIYGIDPELIIPGIAETQPPVIVQPIQPVASIPVLPPVINDPSFSVRTITQLDRGQYYVQVAALPQHSVETAIRQIDRSYGPVVYVERDNLYRILIGPLNQGESAAILARFKSIGYKDAFVRRGI